MLRRARKSLLVIVAAALLAGCGSGDEGAIPSADADNLVKLVNAVEGAVESGDCELAGNFASEFVSAVNSLPSAVGSEVKAGLREAGSRMTALSESPEQCASGASGEAGAEDTTSSTTTDQETTSDEETTTDEETPTEEPNPPADGGGGGGGGGDTGSDQGGGNQTELEVEPGSTSGGIGPGERRAP